MTRQLVWFVAVGVLAMLVHFSVVVWLLVPLGWQPLLANIAGFLVAFVVSYWGHRLKTFRAQGLSHWQTLPRFFAVACLSFAVNELMYFTLLRYSPLGYRAALLLVLVVVAGMTFLLGRYWAFRREVAR